MSEPLDTVRASLVDALTPLLPQAWDIKPGLAPLKQLAATTLFLEYKEIEPLPNAPLGNARCTFNLIVVPGLQDVPKAEETVDAAVLDLILALDAHDWIAWSNATKEGYGDYLGWKVTVSAIASTIRPTPEPEPPAPDNPEE